jgi:drug/metabolite transporter (DMT)-like permease
MTAPPRFARHAALMLVVVTILWGMSFLWTRHWQLAAEGGPVDGLLSGLTLIGLRMPVAMLLLGLAQPGMVLRPTRREHLAGAALGGVFFVGFALQTWGLAHTTPALSAFFTCLCSAWVPPLAWLALGQRVAPLTLLGLAVGLVGCAAIVEGGWEFHLGERLTLAASVLFAVQMLLLDRLGQRMSSAHFTAAFLATTAALGLAGAVVLAGLGPGVATWAEWTGGMLAQAKIAASLVLLALLPTVLGFHWMNTYQPLVSPTRAALIYLLEPVFTAAFSVWWGFEEATTPLLIGGGLILVGNLLVEAPRLLANPAAAR